MSIKRTMEICMVYVEDPNREDGFRTVDLGNYYETGDGERVLFTTLELAEQYGHLVDVPIYVRRV